MEPAFLQPHEHAGNPVTQGIQDCGDVKRPGENDQNQQDEEGWEGEVGAEFAP